MTATPDVLRARRYLLGEASEQESETIEQEYLGHEEGVDRIAAVEDDLIEEYLAGELGPADRARFERVYMEAPHRRVRVETIRRLMARASRESAAAPVKAQGLSWRRVRVPGPWLALAASVLVVASIALWMFRPSGSRQPEIAGRIAPPATAPSGAATSPAPRALSTFALTLSPVAVRSAGESPRVVVPPGTDVVAIQFESEADGRSLVARRATIATVGGDVQWQGPATTGSGGPAGTVARVDVPAAELLPDDYIVTLYGADRAGVEREWSQYLLSVRSR